MDFQVELVEEPVENRGENKTDGGNEGQAAEEGIATGEELAGTGVKGGQGAHAGENHGRVHEGVEPGEAFETVVASHADGQSAEDNERGEGGASGQAGVKGPPGQQRRFPVLEHPEARLAVRVRASKEKWGQEARGRTWGLHGGLVSIL